MRVPIDTHIGFEDAKIRSYTRETRTLRMDIEAWNADTLILTFQMVIALNDFRDSETTGTVVEETEETENLREVLDRLYRHSEPVGTNPTIPKDHGFREYHILESSAPDDINSRHSRPAITIIAKEVQVEHIPR